MIDCAELCIGQMLYCADGSYGVVTNVAEEYFELEYKERKYRRPFSIIGDKLFTTPDRVASNISDKGTETSVCLINESPATPNCSICMKNRSEVCFGNSNVETCDDYIPIPDIPKEKREHWPKYGDATAFKLGEYRND